MRTFQMLSALSLATALALDTETPAAEGGAPAPAADPNTFVFPIAGAKDAAGNDVSISMELGTIPGEVRMDLLKGAVRAYVTNSVNQATVRNNKALAPWTAYEAAMAADPLQTAVAKPEGERPTVDLIATAAAARERLYKGEIRKQGVTKPREKTDPVTKAITDAVVRDLFERTSESTPGYKWTDAVKAVGGDGRKYLEARIAEKVAAGTDEAVLRKVLEERYVKPAELMYGKRTNKNTETSLL